MHVSPALSLFNTDLERMYFVCVHMRSFAVTLHDFLSEADIWPDKGLM